MARNAGWGSVGRPLPAARRVSSGSVSKPISPAWSGVGKPLSAPKRVGPGPKPPLA